MGGVSSILTTPYINIRWWKGEDRKGEWLISGEKNGGLRVVYRARGDRNILPSENWTNVDGSLASDLSVTVVGSKYPFRNTKY